MAMKDVIKYGRTVATALVLSGVLPAGANAFSKKDGSNLYTPQKNNNGSLIYTPPKNEIRRMLPAVENSSVRVVNSTKLSDSVKVGVVKNSALVRVEAYGKAEVLNLKDLYLDMGVATLDRTYRTVASIQDMHIKTKSLTIDGPAVVAAISGKDGIVLIFANANDLKNYMYVAIKQHIVRKGEKGDRYHSQEDGIQRPDLVWITGNGVYWVSRAGEESYEFNFVPLSRVQKVTTTFEASGSTEKWDLKMEGDRVMVVDGGSTLLNAKLIDNFGETAETINSLVEWNGVRRSTNSLSFNIVEDTRSMAGVDVLFEFTSENLGKMCNLSTGSASWESIEIVKPMKNVVREGKEYLVYSVIARNGVGAVEIPVDGFGVDGANLCRFYPMGDKPYDPNFKENPRNFNPAYSINTTGTLLGYVEAKVDAKNHNLSVFSPENRFGFMVELDGKVDRDFSVIASTNGVVLRENNVAVKTIGIEQMLARVSTE